MAQVKFSLLKATSAVGGEPGGKDIEAAAAKLAAEATIPGDLRQQVADALDEDPAQPWDQAVMGVAEGSADDMEDDDSA